MSAVERLRERAEVPPSGPVSLLHLARQVQPDRRGSVRALVLKVFGARAAVHRYAVILCRFKGDRPNPAREEPIATFFRDVFTPGTGGLVEYWRSASLGMVDITGSRVFDWVEIDISAAQAGGVRGKNGVGRAGLVDAAVAAAQRAGHDPLTGYFKPIAVFSRNWRIDGSADGAGRISAPPHGHNGDFLAHEMGHGFGMDHDVGPNNADYYDPCCVMSQNNTFTPPRWGRAFGPAVCLPHLMQRSWMYPRRTYVDGGGWMSQPGGITLPLAPVSRPVARANLGIVLSLRPRLDWDYYLEFATPSGWNEGLKKPYLFVRRIADIPGVGRRVQYLALVEVPEQPDVPASVLEPFGNTLFEVRLTGLKPGPVISVTATKG